MGNWKPMKLKELKRKRWCEEEEYWLTIVYPHIPNDILAERFGTTRRAMDSKGFSLGLKKTEKAKFESSSKSRGRTDMLTYRGYNMVYMPNHPRARKQQVCNHVLVMEKKLGRPLEPNERVVHIDHDKANDDPDNLKIVIRKYREGIVDEQELVAKRKHGVFIDELAEYYGITRNMVTKILKKHGAVDKKASERASKNRRKAFEKKDNKE